MIYAPLPRHLWVTLSLLGVLLCAGCTLATQRDDAVPPVSPTRSPTTTPTTARVAAANASGGPTDSPLVIVEQAPDNQASLLPTVTPTPISRATPFTLPRSVPTPVTTPTRPPELQPIATPYYYDTVEIAHSGISYTVRTDAGFGQFAFNDVSPCLCKDLTDADACRQALADYQQRERVAGVVEGEACVSLELADNRLVVFQDTIPEGDFAVRGVVYQYNQPVTGTNYHFLLTGYWEGGESLLVHSRTGEVTVVPGYPVFAPDNSRFLVMVPMASFAQIWQLNDEGVRYEEGWRLANLPYPYSEIRPEVEWLSATSVHLHWPIPDGYADPPDEPEDVTITLEPQGWEVYRHGQTLPRLIIDPNSIRFANGGIDDHLDTLGVGKPLYIDQEYVFTDVPDELAQAIRFRLPQSYYLGEHPSYFPLEAQLGNYLSFRVTDEADVYVGLDAAVDAMPDWMQEGWEVAPFTVETDDIPLRLYHKQYAKGALVELVDKWMEEGRVPTQFVVLVKAVES